MEKIYQRNGFAIIENDDKFQITWAEGPYGNSVFYDISKENMKKALKSEEDAYEVMIYAETGRWSLQEEEKLKKNKEFIRQFPELLIKVPANQALFDKDELKILLSQAKKYNNK